VRVCFPVLQNSLAASIKHTRPDLLSDVTVLEQDRISDTPPRRRALGRDVPYIEDIGEPTEASFFSSATINPEHWYITAFFFELLKLEGGEQLGGCLKNMTEFEDSGIH